MNAKPPAAVLKIVEEIQAENARLGMDPTEPEIAEVIAWGRYTSRMSGKKVGEAIMFVAAHCVKIDTELHHKLMEAWRRVKVTKRRK